MRLRKKVKYVAINIGAILKNLIVRKKSPEFYIEKVKKFDELGKRFKAYKILKKGLNLYPDNLKLCKELALYAMHEKDWKRANYYWGLILRSNQKQFSSQDYLNFSMSLQRDNQKQKSVDVLVFGITKCLNNEDIITELAQLIDHDKNTKGTFQPQITAENKKEFSDYVNKAIRMQDWSTAIQRLEGICKVYTEEMSLNILVKLSMLYQLTGNKDKANQLFQNVLDVYPEQIKMDKKQYRKITLFDNGESRIEFYKRLGKTTTVVVTFDSINMVWKNPSFAFNLLMKQDVDIVAIRKRRKQTYQQDLSIDDFYSTVNLLVSGYKDKFAYGFSLGAYGAMYYASKLNCRILALSPRLSIHPLYGKTKLKGKFSFKHDLHHVHNSKISPIIVYDPKDSLDNIYVNEGLLPSYPNAKLVEIPYGSHAIGPHLLKMGLLKEFVITALREKKVPIYNKEMRKKSSIYYRVLGDTCLKRNKPKWALNLANQALNLTPQDNLSMRLKIHALKGLELDEEAIHFARKSKELCPSDRVIRLLLIDLYVKINEINSAEREIYLGIKQFGKRTSLIKRKEQIFNKRDCVEN